MWGQALLENNLDFVYSIVWLLGLGERGRDRAVHRLSGGIARLTNIRFALTGPVYLHGHSFAAFQSRAEPDGLVALFAIGFLWHHDAPFRLVPPCVSDRVCSVQPCRKLFQQRLRKFRHQVPRRLGRRHGLPRLGHTITS